MQISGQRQLGILSLAVAGALLGSVTGFWLGRAMLLRTARLALSDYAGELVAHGETLSREIDLVSRRVKAPHFSYCSDEELSSLQAQTFRSQDLKDIGRTHAGKLHCSAFLGRLATPYEEGPPSLVLANGTNIYTHVAVILASSEAAHGTVIELDGVDAVLNPNAFERWNRPHMRYMIAAVNPVFRGIAPIAGSDLPVTPEFVVSRRFALSSGTVYRSRCSDRAPVCVVTAEDIADIWGWSRAMQTAYAVLGGLAGLGFGFAVALLLLQTRTMGYRLHRAVRRDSPSIQLVYEPILDLATRRFLGAEALLRWVTADGVTVRPDVFVPLAEGRGFIGELTALVLRRATSEAGDLLRNNPEFTISINVAPSDMKTGHIFSLLDRYVDQAGILHHQIALELTERSTADLAMMRVAIQRLVDDGYKVYIDDFGTGFSSLSYLDQLAVTAIKIDRAFTRTLGTDAVTAPILPHILDMVDSLGMEVIVEGVETGLQLDYLQSTSKPLKLQGWFFSKPLTGSQLGPFCQRRVDPQPSFSQGLGWQEEQTSDLEPKEVSR